MGKTDSQNLIQDPIAQSKQDYLKSLEVVLKKIVDTHQIKTLGIYENVMDILPNTYSIGNFEEVLNKALSSNMPFTD